MSDKPDLARLLHQGFVGEGPYSHVFDCEAGPDPDATVTAWEMTVEGDGTMGLSGRVVGTPEAIDHMLARLEVEGITASVSPIEETP